jgi:hypothetical protein
MSVTSTMRPALRRTIDSSASHRADGVTPTSSVVLGITVLADGADVPAVLRTAVLLAKNVRATLYLDLPGKDIFEVHFGRASSPKMLSGLLDSVEQQPNEVVAMSGPGFGLEATIIAASFVSAGSISMRVRSASSLPDA